jgi:hypothetical protein
MPTRPREEISFGDLQAVLDAATLLRCYNLITIAHVHAIRGNVHADVAPSPTGTTVGSSSSRSRRCPLCGTRPGRSARTNTRAAST